jgi:tetratricopeptide (TPR) repeat protein
MTDSRAAARHAAEGLALWQQDRFDEAEAEYQAALAAAPVDDPARADYHGELAAVLEAAGKHHAAEQQLRAALASELALAGDGDATGVNVARYFLAGFLVRHGEARTALDDIAPHLVPHAGGVWLLHAVAAEAWLALADADAADAAARLALRAAPSDDQRSELRLRFLEIGLHDAAI